MFVTPSHLRFSDSAFIQYRVDTAQFEIKNASEPEVNYCDLIMIYAAHAYLTIKHLFAGVEAVSQRIYQPFTVSKVMNEINEFLQKPISRSFKKKLALENPTFVLRGKRRFADFLLDTPHLTRLRRRGQLILLSFQ